MVDWQGESMCPEKGGLFGSRTSRAADVDKGARSGMSHPPQFRNIAL